MDKETIWHQGKIKKWGNASLALIIPAKDVKELELKPDQQIKYKLSNKKNVIMDTFGTLKEYTFKQSVKQSRQEDEENDYR